MFFWILTTLICLLWYFMSRSNTSLFTLFILIIFLNEVTDYTLINTSFSNFCKNSIDVNLLLVNNLNKYHPFLLYTSVSILSILRLCLTLSFYNITAFSSSKTFYCYITTLYTLNTFIIIALFLGS